MIDDGFSWDVVECAVCGEPAPYRLWRGERLLACHCDVHHNEWWNNRDLALVDAPHRTMCTFSHHHVNHFAGGSEPFCRG